MGRYFESPLLGMCETLIGNEINELRRMIQQNPAKCFAELNKHLNKKKLMLMIMKMKDSDRKYYSIDDVGDEK